MVFLWFTRGQILFQITISGVQGLTCTFFPAWELVAKRSGVPKGPACRPCVMSWLNHQNIRIVGICIHIYIYVCVSIYIYVCVSIYICVCVSIYICVCIYIYIMSGQQIIFQQVDIIPSGQWGYSAKHLNNPRLWGMSCTIYTTLW